MRDNIGNEIHMGDHVFCFTGQSKNTIKQVKSFRIIKETLGSREAVNFTDDGWLSAYNVLALEPLGITEYHVGSRRSIPTDALGHPLNVGDVVLFLHSMEMYAEKGRIKKLSPKSCVLDIKLNRFGQTEYRRKYEEIISLTAIGRDDIEFQHESEF